MKKMFVTGCVLSIFLVFGCNSSSSPKQVLAKFLAAMEHGDIKEAKKYASTDSQSFLNKIDESNDGSVDVYKDQDLEVTDNVRIDGSDAKVEVKSHSAVMGVDFHLRKENGEWKVVFNLESLFNTAIDVIKKAGQDVHKEVDNTIDSIKSSLDTLH